jgi:hypothetical protein
MRLKRAPILAIGLLSCVITAGIVSAREAACSGVLDTEMEIDFSKETDVARTVRKADEADITATEFPLNTGARRQGVTAAEKQKVVFVSRTFSIQGGEELLVDADSDNPAAYVSIALQDPDGNEIPRYGYADSQILVDDAADQVVTWNAHRWLPEGVREVRLQVTLHNATIFAVKTRAVAAPPSAPLAVGLNRQLFADPTVIDQLEGGAHVELHSPENRGVVMTLDQPWEGNTCAYLTALKDGEKYRLYYRGWDHGSKKHPVL